MTLSRRDFTRLCATAAAAGVTLPRGLAAATRRQQQTIIAWQPYGQRMVIGTGSGGNVGLYSNGGEALLIDAKNPGYGFSLRREAEARGTPLRLALNTHHHPDHIGGNAVLTADLPLLAHPTAIDRIRTWAAANVGKDYLQITTQLRLLRESNGNPALIADLERAQEQIRTVAPDRFVPTRAVRDGEELKVGGRTVILRHVGAGHTDNDVFLHFPEDNLLFAGDLVFAPTTAGHAHPTMDAPGGMTSTGWQRSLDVLMGLTNGATLVFPGHGTTANRDIIRLQNEYFSKLRDAVAAAIREGKTKEETMALRPETLASMTGNPSRNLGVVYDELKGS